MKLRKEKKKKKNATAFQRELRIRALVRNKICFFKMRQAHARSAIAFDLFTEPRLQTRDTVARGPTMILPRVGNSRGSWEAANGVDTIRWELRNGDANHNDLELEFVAVTARREPSRISLRPQWRPHRSASDYRNPRTRRTNVTFVRVLPAYLRLTELGTRNVIGKPAFSTPWSRN